MKLTPTSFAARSRVRDLNVAVVSQAEAAIATGVTEIRLLTTGTPNLISDLIAGLHEAPLAERVILSYFLVQNFSGLGLRSRGC